MILSITGPSGVGKTTLLHNLLQHIPNARPLTSYTTRAARPTDEPGEYIYASEYEFDDMSTRGAFAWEARPHGKRYATRLAAITDALASPRVFVAVLVIDAVQKLHAIANEQGKAEAVKSLYLELRDEAELRRRFEARGDMSAPEVESRIVECRSWRAQATASGVPFIYLSADSTRDQIAADALSAVSI